jgi:hypothetical protein
VNDATPNIIGPDTSTSLRYEGNTYTQKFIAVHRPIWNASKTDAQVSIFFTDPRGNMFHICIPIVFTEVAENVFLKLWLHDEELKVPGGTTINDLLNFPQEKVTFATIQYCLQYNGTRSLNPYTLCYFQTPLSLNANNVGTWLTKLLTDYEIPKETETGKKYMRNTFDEIFNLMMLGTVKFYNTNLVEAKLVSNEDHIDSTSKTQSAVKAVFYKVRTSDLSGKKSTMQPAKGVKGISNVKCYPIDLANQIDEQGNIFIDENTNKPIDLKGAIEPEGGDFSASAYAGAEAERARVAAAANANQVTYIVILSVLFIILFGLLIAFVIWVLPGSSHGAASPVAAAAVAPVSAAVAAAAVAPVAAAAAAVNSNSNTNSVNTATRTRR